MSKPAWKKGLQSNRFLRSILTLSSGTAASQVILIMVTPILTRFYMPKDFGVFAVFAASLSIMVVVSALRYELAIPLPRNRRSARQLVVLALLINSLGALFVLVVVALFREDIAKLVKTPALASYLWLLPVGVISAGTYKIFNFWAVRNKNYKDIAHTKLTQSIANVSVQLTAAFVGLGALGLIVGQLVGQTAGALRLSRGVELRSIFKMPRTFILRTKVLVKQYKNFPKYDVPASAFNTMSAQLPNILLATLFSPVVAGHYLLVMRVLAMPTSLVGQAVGQVFYGNCREALISGSLGRDTKHIALILFSLIMLPAILIFFWGSDLFPLIFGNHWQVAGTYAKWMILGSAAQFVYAPISMVLMSTNGQRLNLCINIFLLLGKVVGVLFGYHLDRPLVTIIIFSITGMLIYGFSVLLILLRAKKYDHIFST